MQACDATVVQFGDGARDRFRTKHNPCGAVVDVSLGMLRRGGWVCQMCKLSGTDPRGCVDYAPPWPVARQEQLFAAAGLRPLSPLVTQTAPSR